MTMLHRYEGVKSAEWNTCDSDTIDNHGIIFVVIYSINVMFHVATFDPLICLLKSVNQLQPGF